MNTDIKSLIPSMHAELKRMQFRVADLQSCSQKLQKRARTTWLIMFAAERKL